MSTTALPTPARFRFPTDRIRAAMRGSAADPRWVRPALLTVLAIAAALCLWNLTISGYSNDYYAAAVKAGSESWKALFFGSLDPGSFITVDKPPLSLWLMGISARAFGFSSFNMLLPEALCTIAAVGLLYATVRRAFGPAAGIAAAAALATTPVTVAIARVNNPDALLVLLLVASAYMLQRAVESGRTRHLALCGAVVGLAFMTKMLEGWMVVPAFVAAYVVAGPPRLSTRLRQLAVAGCVMVAVSAAWPIAVSLWPAASRPYIGGSTNGSIWNLIFGYNGFGRLTGGSGPGGGAGFGGTPGALRMFNDQVGGQVAWLLPLAAVGLVAGLWLSRRSPRTDRRRAGWILFGLWALVLVIVFSAQNGIFHPYYVSALAPAVAALAGAGIVTLWRWARRSWAGVALLDAAIIANASVAVVLLERTPSFVPALRTLIPLTAAAAVCASPLLVSRPRRGLLAAAACAAALALVAGPFAYSVASVGHALDGNNVTAGPTSAAALGGGPGMSGPAVPQSGYAPPFAGGQPPAGPPPFAAGRQAGASPAPGGSLTGKAIAFLEAHQGSAKYLVAAVGSHVTAPIIVKTGRAVVTIGGFNGSDPTPTVSQLAQLVERGELKYVLLTESGGPGHVSSALTAWVKSHGTPVEGVGVGGLYEVHA